MVSIPEAAEATGLKACCIRNWCKSGAFKGYVMAGRKYLINLEKLAEFLEKGSS